MISTTRRTRNTGRILDDEDIDRIVKGAPLNSPMMFSILVICIVIGSIICFGR